VIKRPPRVVHDLSDTPFVITVTAVTHRREPIPTAVKMAFALRASIPRNVDSICAGAASRETKSLILFHNILKLRSFGSRINPLRIQSGHAHNKMMKKVATTVEDRKLIIAALWYVAARPIIYRGEMTLSPRGQTLTIFLVFLGTASFFLRIFYV
jgi:hypothetical protein